MKKILLTGGGGAAAEGIWRYWGEKYTLFFADADKKSISPTIPDANKIEIPFANADNFIPEMIRICDTYGIDVLIPGVDEELPLCHKIILQTKQTQLLLPNHDFVTAMMDKYGFISALSKSGLNAPKTYLASDLKHIPDDFFPAIMKPIYGRGSRGVSVIKSKEQAKAYLVLSDKSDNQIIIQHYAKGDEYTVFMASDSQGNLAGIIPVKVGVKRGITIRAETDDNPYIIDYCQKFHHHFKPNCVYNIQLIVDKNNVIYPFEVNPRISTTFILAISTGFDPLEYFFGKQTENIFIPTQRMTLQRYWINDIKKL